MAIDHPGVNANATLNGVHTTTPAKSWTIIPRAVKSSVRLARGRHREESVHLGRRRELNPRVFEIKIEWSSLKNRRQIEELLLSPAPHQVCLWRYEALSYHADGFITEFELPWLSAVDSVAWSTFPGIPSGRPASHFEPEVKVGIDGAALTFVQKTAAGYDSGSPAAGEVWFKGGTKLFKVGSAPGTGTILYVWMVPIFSMIEAAEDQEKRLRAATHEPHSLRLLEAAG